MLRGFFSQVVSSAPVSKVTTPWSSRPTSTMSSRKPSISDSFEPPQVDLSGFSAAERAQLEAVLNRVDIESKTASGAKIIPQRVEVESTQPLTGLTAAEQQQIEAVLKRAEAELSMSTVTKSPMVPKSSDQHKFDLSEFDDAERQRLEQMIKLADLATEAAVKAMPTSAAPTDNTSAYSSRKCSTVSNTSLASPSVNEIDMSGLSAEEKLQIEAVMRRLDDTNEPQITHTDSNLVESGFEPNLSDSTYQPVVEDTFEPQVDLNLADKQYDEDFCQITTPSPAAEPTDNFDEFTYSPARQKSTEDSGRFLPASPLPSRPQSPFLRADSRYDPSAILAEVDLTQFSEAERAHIEEVLSRAASNSSISPVATDSNAKTAEPSGKSYLSSPDYPSYPPTPGATFTPAYGEIFSEEPEVEEAKRPPFRTASSRDRWEAANLESSGDLKAKRRPKWAERHVSVDEVEMGSYSEDLVGEMPIKADLEEKSPLSPQVEPKVSEVPAAKPLATGQQPNGQQIRSALESLGIDTSGITADEQFHIYSVMLRAGTISPLPVEIATVDHTDLPIEDKIDLQTVESAPVDLTDLSEGTIPQEIIDETDLTDLQNQYANPDDFVDDTTALESEDVNDANLQDEFYQEEVYDDDEYVDNQPDYEQSAYQHEYDNQADEQPAYQTEEFLPEEITTEPDEYPPQGQYEIVDELTNQPIADDYYPEDNNYQLEDDNYGQQDIPQQDFYEPSPIHDYAEPVDYTTEPGQIDYFDDGEYPEPTEISYDSRPDRSENLNTDEYPMESTTAEDYYQPQSDYTTQLESNEENLQPTEDYEETPAELLDNFDDRQIQPESFPTEFCEPVDYVDNLDDRQIQPESFPTEFCEPVDYVDNFDVENPPSPRSSATEGADSEENLSDHEGVGEFFEEEQIVDETEAIRKQSDLSGFNVVSLPEPPAKLPEISTVATPPIVPAKTPVPKLSETPKETSMFSGFLSASKPGKSGFSGFGGFGSALSTIGSKAIGAAHTVTNFAEANLQQLDITSDAHLSKPSSPQMQISNPEFPGLTAEEIAHIQRITAMANAESQFAPLPKPLEQHPVAKPTETVPVAKPIEIYPVAKPSETVPDSYANLPEADTYPVAPQSHFEAEFMPEEILPVEQQLSPTEEYMPDETYPVSDEFYPQSPVEYIPEDIPSEPEWKPQNPSITNELTEAELAQIRAKAEAAGIQMDLPSAPSLIGAKKPETLQPKTPDFFHSFPVSMPKSSNLISTFGSLKSSTESLSSKTFGFSGFGAKLGLSKSTERLKSSQRSPSPSLSPTVPTVADFSQSGLSAAEIAQIEEISRRAERELSGSFSPLPELQPDRMQISGSYQKPPESPAVVPSGIIEQLKTPQHPVAPELTPEEIAHIQRIAEMAESSGFGPVAMPKTPEFPQRFVPADTVEPQRYQPETVQPQDTFVETTIIPQEVGQTVTVPQDTFVPETTVRPHVEKGSFMPETTVIPQPVVENSLYSGLTAAEIEQIERITMMAQMEGFEPFEQPPIVAKIEEKFVAVEEIPQLTEENFEPIADSLSSISDYRQRTDESCQPQEGHFHTDTDEIPPISAAASDYTKPLSLSVESDSMSKPLVSPRRSNPFLFDMAAADSQEPPEFASVPAEYYEATDFQPPSYQYQMAPNNSPCSNTLSSSEVRLEDETTYEYPSEEILQSDNSALSDKNPFLTADYSQPAEPQFLSPTGGEIPTESDEDLSDVELTDKQRELLSAYRETMTEVHKLSPSPEFRFMPEFPEFDQVEKFAVPTATVASQPVQHARLEHSRPVEILPEVRKVPAESFLPPKQPPQPKTPSTPQSSSMFGSLTNIFASPAKTPMAPAASSSFGFSLGKLSKIGDTVKSQVKSVTSATSSTASSRRSSISDSTPDLSAFQPDLSGLTAEEAAHIQAVMATFSQEDVRSSPVPPIVAPTPIELSEAERLHIEEVMRKAAESDMPTMSSTIQSSQTTSASDQQSAKRMSTSHTSFGSDISRPETDDTGYQSQLESTRGSPEDRGFSPVEIHPDIPETITEEQKVDSHYGYQQQMEDSWYQQQQQPQPDYNDYSQSYTEQSAVGVQQNWTETPVTTSQPQIISFPDMPDLDLSQFCEEERAHIIGMLCKAREFEQNFGQSAPPILLTEADQIGPQQQQQQISPQPTMVGRMIIPEIREIQPTPEEDSKDVAEAFDQRLRESEEISSNSSVGDYDYTSEDLTAVRPQHYDSSDFSADFVDEDDEERRIREIEAEFAIYAEHVLNRSYLNQDICPLCHVTNLQLRPDGTTVTGQICAECGLTACAKCGRVVSTIKREKRQWICAMCHSRRELAALTEQRIQKRESIPRQIDSRNESRADKTQISSVESKFDSPVTQQSSEVAYQSDSQYVTESQTGYQPTPADSYSSDQYSGYYDSSYQSQSNFESPMRHSAGFSASLTEQSNLPDEAYIYGPNEFYQSVANQQSQEISIASMPELIVETPSPTSPNSDAILTPNRRGKKGKSKEAQKAEDSDDSEPEEPDSDEDYPDEIIEVPTLPTAKFTDDFSHAKEELNNSSKGDDIIHEITKAFATGLDYNDAEFDQFVSATRAKRAEKNGQTATGERNIFSEIQSLCAGSDVSQNFSPAATITTTKSPSKSPTPPPIPARSVTPPGTIGSITLPPPIPRVTTTSSSKLTDSTVETYDNNPIPSEFLSYDSSSHPPVTLASADGYLGTISTSDSTNIGRLNSAVTYTTAAEPHLTDSTSSAATSASGYTSDKEFLSYEEDEEDESSSSYSTTDKTDKRQTQPATDDDIDVQQAAKYYNNSAYLMHTPGPVYTIPEDDEEETEAQYYSDSSKGGSSQPYLDVASSEEDGSDVDEEWKFRVATQEQFASGGNDIADEFVLAAGYSLTGLTSSAMLSIANVTQTFTTSQSRPGVTPKSSSNVTFATPQRPETTKTVSSLQYYQQQLQQQQQSGKPSDLQAKRGTEPLRIITGLPAASTSQPQVQSGQNSPPFSPKDPMFSHFNEDVIREQHEHRHESPSPTKKQQFRHFHSTAADKPSTTVTTGQANMQIYSDIRISPPDKTISREQLYGRGEANVPSGNLQGRPIPTSPGEEVGNKLEFKSLPTAQHYPSSSSQSQPQLYGSQPQSQSYQQQYGRPVQSQPHYDLQQQSFEPQKQQPSQSQVQFDQQQQSYNNYVSATTSQQSSGDTAKIIYAKSVKPKVKMADSQNGTQLQPQQPQQQQQLQTVQTAKKPKSKGHSDWSPISDLSPILDVSPSAEQAEAEVMSNDYDKLDGTTITAVVQANGQIIPIGNGTRQSQLLKQQQQDQFVSKLKRSPAMILHGSNNNGNGSGAEMDPKDSLYAKLTEENQRLRAAVASVAAAAAATNPFLTGPNPFLPDANGQLSEDDYGLAMGRRRLPSVPQSQIPYQLGSSDDNLSFGPPQAAVALQQSQLSRNSPQRSRSNANVNLNRRDVNAFEHCNGVATFSGLKPGQNLFDYAAERKSLTSLSNGSLPTGYGGSKKEPIGTTAKPVVNSSSDIYQTVTSATLARGGKISATLARVLLKQELREALAVRRQQLEASEIEANQREYVVKQMVQTGRKYPKFRYGEEGPTVIRCDLPLELIAGAKVVPTVTTVSTGTQKGSRKLPSAKDMPKTASVPTVNNFLAPPTPSKRRQLPEPKSEPPTATVSSTVSTRYDFTPVSTRPTVSAVSKSRSTRESATQTLSNKPSATPVAYSFAPKLTEELRYTSVDSSEFDYDRRQQKRVGLKTAPIDLFSMKSVGVGTSDNLLLGEAEILRGRKRSPKSKKLTSSYFSDEDDTESRELRKLRLREEINRRRQKLSSIGDLSDLSRLEDYQSTSTSAALPYGNLPQYGSLPRHLEYSMMKQAVNSYPENMRDLQLQQQQQQVQSRFNPSHSGFATIGPNGFSDKFRPQYRSADLTGLNTDSSYRQGQFGGYQNLTNMSSMSRSLPYLNGRQPQQLSTGEFDSYRGAPVPLPYQQQTQLQMPTAYSSGLSGAQQSNMLSTSYQPQSTRQGYNQPITYGRQPQQPQTNSSDTGLLSHYASYLNNHFDFGSTVGPVRPYVEDYGTVGTHHPRDFIDPNFSLYGGLDITQRGQMRSNQPDPILAEYDSLYSSRYRTAPTVAGRSNLTPYGTQGNFGAQPNPVQMSNSSWPTRNPYETTGSKSAYNRSYSEPNDYNNQMVDRGYNTANSYMSAARSRIHNDPSRYYSQNIPTPDNNFAYDKSTATSYQQQQQQQQNTYGGYKLGLNQLTGGYGSRQYGQQGQTVIDPLRNPMAYQYDMEMQNGMSRSRSGYTPPYDSRPYGQKSYAGPNRMFDSLPRQSRGRGPTDINELFRSNGFQHSQQSKKHLPNGNNNRSDMNFRDRTTGQPNPTTTNLMAITDPHNSRNIKRILLSKDKTMKVGSGLGMKVLGGKILPGTDGVLGAYIAKIYPGGVVDTLGEVKEGDQILEWNGIPLTGCSYEEVQQIIANSQGEIEALVKCDSNLNDLSKRDSFDRGYESGGTENNVNLNNFNSGEAVINRLSVDRPDQPVPDGTASPCFSTTPRSGSPYAQYTSDFYCPGELKIRITFDPSSSTLFATVYCGRNIRAPSRTGYPNPFVKIYLLPGRRLENKRRTKYILNTSTPQWNQTVVYKDVSIAELRDKYLEFTVWDYERFEENKFIGELMISLQDSDIINGPPRWYTFNSRAAAQQYTYTSQMQPDLYRTTLVYPEQQGISPGIVPVISESSSSISSTSATSYILMSPSIAKDCQIVDSVRQLWYRTDHGKLDLVANLAPEEIQMLHAGSIDMQIGLTHGKTPAKAVVAVRIHQCRNLSNGSNTRKQAYFIKLYLFQRCKRICKLKTKTRSGSDCPRFDTILRHEVSSTDNLVMQVVVWKNRWPFKSSSIVGESFLHVPIGYDLSDQICSYQLFAPRWSAKSSAI